MTRAELIIAILELWVADESLANAIDERSYTHASCGYESAQSDVMEYLTLSVEQLSTVYDYMKERIQ